MTKSDSNNKPGPVVELSAKQENDDLTKNFVRIWDPILKD